MSKRLDIGTIEVLDNGYVAYIEHLGDGEAGASEAGIIEAARQSTQGSFRGWNKWLCSACGNSFNEQIQHSTDGSVIGSYPPSAAMVCVTPKWSNDEKMLSFMASHNHTTPFEFCHLVIETQAPIFVIREWQRHRTMSYNEMSARYAPLPDVNFTPSLDRLFWTQDDNKQSQAVDGTELTKDRAINWQQQVRDFYDKAEQLYQYGLGIGVPKELARIVLPVGRYSRMRVSANLHNWLKFCAIRMDYNAQYEIRQYAKAVGAIISQVFPRSWMLFTKNHPELDYD